MRAFAAILDILILLMVTVPVLFWIYGPGYFFSNESPQGFWDLFTDYQGFWDVVINIFFPLIATILFWKYKSATPGKMMMGIAIVDAETGGVPVTGKLVLRYFAYLVSIVPLLFGFIWIAFDKRKQSFHDKLADTLVIRSDASDESDGEARDGSENQD